MLVSFQMLPEQPVAELLEAIAEADRLGYHACYSADEIYHKEPWSLFGAAPPEPSGSGSGHACRRCMCESQPFWPSRRRPSMS